jgi:hypothetical protein
MKLEYPTLFKDARGTEYSKFITDGKSLKIELRGITFEGHFWELTPLKGQKENAQKCFDLNEDGYLNGIIDLNTMEVPNGYFSVDVKIPIKIVNKDNTETDGIFEFGTNVNKMNFIINGKIYPSEKPSFEYGMDIEHTKSLNIHYIKCCINCKFSSYSPFGNQVYGDMMCFKNCKEAWSMIGYSGLKYPDNWTNIKRRENTQEAFWCSEFELKESESKI